MKFALMVSAIAGVDGHGAMTHPRPRNAMSSQPVAASQGSDLSCYGDACYWYQVGCMIGCPTCQANLDHKGCGGELCCSVSDGLMEPTNNDPEFRTWDPYGQSANPDRYKYNPWRAPGKAPVIDPCGIASGGTNPNAYSAVPGGYNGGDKASEVLPETDATLWQAGATATVGWALSAQHSGGYSYRLCPKDSSLSEECFKSNVLTFAGANSSIHWNDDSKPDRKIMTRTYIAPDESQWRTNPIPACLSGSETWPAHGSATPDCTAGTMFEPGFDEFTQGFLRPGNTGKNKFSVMDEVNVPNKPGKYILGWRWDCEEADQVWTSCADIEIVDGPVPAPAPPSHEADGTCPSDFSGDCSTDGCMTRDSTGNCLECCQGCSWMYNRNGNICTGGKKPTPKPTPSPSPVPSPSPGKQCDGFTPDAATYACYYNGCAEYEEGSKDCKTCCTGCHLQTDSIKGSFCMEDKVTFV